MTPLTRLRAALRQRRRPASFRIAPPGGDAEIAALVAAIPKSASGDAAAPDAALPDAARLVDDTPADVAVQAASESPPLDDGALADAATNLWRAQRRLARDAQKARDRPTARYLRSCRDALADAGLVIQEHDGDVFHPGRSIEVLAFQEEEGRTAEVVLETVRPTVYLHDRRIQMAQVIVVGPTTNSNRSDHADQQHH